MLVEVVAIDQPRREQRAERQSGEQDQWRPPRLILTARATMSKRPGLPASSAGAGTISQVGVAIPHRKEQARVTRRQLMLGSLVAGAVLSASAAHAGEGPVSSAEEVSPILVGTPAPDGTVKAEDGKETTLGSLRAGRPAVLVFYRGHW